MRPLTADDLLPLDEYAPRRDEYFACLQRYLDRYRKVRVGPQVTLLFENRQTLWFLVQEVLRIARLSEPRLVQQQLDLYNRLLPSRDCLQAALIVDAPAQESASWQTLRGDEIVLCLGSLQSPARLITCRPEDRCLGAVHWLQFVVDGACRKVLADPKVPARIEIHCAHYRHDSALLSDEMRQSLLDDLTLSDRDD